MEMTIGDICDKWTITRMKYRATKNPQLRIVLDELEEEVMKSWEVAETLQQWVAFSHAIFTLIEINAQMWRLEAELADLRSIPQADSSMIGRVALDITAANKIRVLAIKTINDIFAM